MPETSHYYWTGFLTFCFIAIGIGYISYRRIPALAPDHHEFWTAGKKISGWSAGLSISASMMSISWSCVYGVQLLYWYGVGGLWLLAIPWLLAMAGFFAVAPRLHRMTSFSQPEMVGARFGLRARQLLALPLAFVYLVWCGAEIYAAAHVLAPLLDTSRALMLVLIAGTVATYSYLGGLTAVVATDRFQYFLAAFFIATIAGFGMNAVLQRADFFDFLSSLPTPPKAQAPATSLRSTGLALMVMTFIAYLPGWSVTTDVWIKMQATRNSAEARKGVAIAAFNSLVFIAVLPLCIGLSALYLYPPQNGVIPERLQDGARIFTAMMQDFSPLSLSVFLAVGLAAVAMSTIDTTGNVLALSLSYDLLEISNTRWLSPHLRTNLPRYITLLAIALALLYALFIESLWDIFYLSSGILTTTIFIPMVAVFIPSAKPRQVHAAILTGFVGTLSFYFLETRGYLAGLQPDWLAAKGLGYILWGFIAAVLAFIGFGRISSTNSRALRHEGAEVGKASPPK